MRVANIIEEGRIGGPQRRIMHVAAGLKKQGVETTVIVPHWGSEAFRKALAEWGIASCPLPLTKPATTVGGFLNYMLRFPIELLSLTRHLKRAGYDVVHVSGGSWQFRGVLAARLAGIPVLWHLNDTHTIGLVRRGFELLKGLPTGFIVTAERVRNYYLPNGIKPEQTIMRIPAPVDTAYFSPFPDFMPTDSGGACKLVIVGNVSPVKGYEYLLEACGLLADRGVGVKLTVVGALHDSQATYNQTVLEMAASLDTKKVKVDFVGMQNDARPFYQDADIAVCSSIHEAGPMAVWEAMSMGCAVVSTDVGDVPRELDQGRTGVIVPTRDPEAMADAIEELARQPELRSKMGQLARAHAVKFLDLSRTVELHAEVYRQACR